MILTASSWLNAFLYDLSETRASYTSAFNINLQWLETGDGEMFYNDTEQEIEEIISLYKRLNPFFKKFIIRQLRDLIEFK